MTEYEKYLDKWNKRVIFWSESKRWAMWKTGPNSYELYNGCWEFTLEGTEVVLPDGHKLTTVDDIVEVTLGEMGVAWAESFYIESPMEETSHEQYAEWEEGLDDDIAF